MSLMVLLFYSLFFDLTFVSCMWCLSFSIVNVNRAVYTVV